MTPAPTKPISHNWVESVIVPSSESAALQNAADYTGKSVVKAVPYEKVSAALTINTAIAAKLGKMANPQRQ
jgi:hypothetical protein